MVSNPREFLAWLTYSSEFCGFHLSSVPWRKIRHPLGSLKNGMLAMDFAWVPGQLCCRELGGVAHDMERGACLHHDEELSDLSLKLSLFLRWHVLMVPHVKVLHGSLILC